MVNRKTAAAALATDVALLLALAVAGAPTWALIVLGVLAVPAIITLAIPAKKQDVP